MTYPEKAYLQTQEVDHSLPGAEDGGENELQMGMNVLFRILKMF